MQDMWAGQEHEIISQPWNAEMAVPFPIAYADDVFDMDYVGVSSQAAPQLHTARLDKTELGRAFDPLVDGLWCLTTKGLAHGDLSVCNLLWCQRDLWFIDFPQTTDLVATCKAWTSCIATLSMSAPGSTARAMPLTPTNSSPNFFAGSDASSVPNMGMRMMKPVAELTEATIDALPAQLGVYEIVDLTGATIKIGYAGGRETFGMRTALHRELTDDVAGGLGFRHEFTHGYLTRWQELLMLYKADHGALPSGNADHLGTLGRLSPLSAEPAPTGSNSWT